MVREGKIKITIEGGIISGTYSEILKDLGLLAQVRNSEVCCVKSLRCRK